MNDGSALQPSGRLMWRILAGFCVALAAIGAVLPVVPTTPFLLAAAWAAKRGAPEMYERLHAHAIWGPTLCHWRDQRAIGSRAKALAVITMSASWLFLWFFAASPIVLGITAATFLCVAAFVLTRPTPRRV
jgi:uncharacterized membrane protein YbaN (DUF454 family)